MKIETVWCNVLENIEKLITLSDSHKHIFRIFEDIETHTSNICFYSVQGFPLEYIINKYMNKLFGSQKEQIYNNSIYYSENPYYFTIDLDNPNQCKNVSALSDFIKFIVSHKPMSNSNSKHIIVIHNVDLIFSNDSIHAFRILLEKYLKSAIFITSTYRFSKLEGPLKSRLLNIRLPLFSSQDLQTFFRECGLNPPPDGERNLYRAVYLSLIEPKNQQYCMWNINELRKGIPKTNDCIRKLSQKLFTSDVSLTDLLTDLTKLCKNDTQKANILHYICNCDMKCILSNNHHRILYIEAILLFAKNEIK